MKDISSIIKDIDKLKPIPKVAHKVMALVEDPQSSMQDLADIITLAPSLTANILKLCNSGYIGLSQRVESVQQAIVFLGMDQIVNLVVMSGGAESINTKQEGYDLDEGELWRYSVSSALLTKELAEMKGIKKHHVLFTAALIKDIGKVVLNQYVADSIEKINFLVSKHNFSFREAEKAVIGIDHAELGSTVAKKWNFSPKMVDIICYHHMPLESPDLGSEVSLVYMADVLSMMMGIGVGLDGLSYRFHKNVIENLEFSERDIQTIMAGFGEKMQEVEELISVVG